MKTLAAALSTAIVLSTPAFAQTSAEEFFAMSNASAAEIMVNESSMGDITAARIRLALGNMSAVEREAFFGANHIERLKILEEAVFFGDGNSAAEMAAESQKLMEAQQ